MGVPKSTLQAQLAGLYDLLDVNRIDAYELAKPHILSAAEELLIQDMVDPDRRAKASLNNTAYAFRQVHDANRLARGETTSNVGLLAAIMEADPPKTVVVKAKTEIESNAT